MIFGFKSENLLLCSRRLFGKSHSTLKIFYTSLESPTKTSPLGTHKRMTLVPVRPLYTSATGKTFSRKPLSILSMKLHVIFHKGPGALSELYFNTNYLKTHCVRRLLWYTHKTRENSDFLYIGQQISFSSIHNDKARKKGSAPKRGWSSHQNITLPILKLAFT